MTDQDISQYVPAAAAETALRLTLRIQPSPDGQGGFTFNQIFDLLVEVVDADNNRLKTYRADHTRAMDLGIITGTEASNLQTLVNNMHDRINVLVRGA